MAERLTLLVNPVAGGGSTLARWPDLPRVLAGRGEVTTVSPADPAAFDRAARAAADAGHTIVIAGGDGTVNRVINALDGVLPPIGIVPVGSGNDFSRCLGLPLDPLVAAARIVSGGIRRVDLVRVNGRRFCTVGGLGLFGDVVDAVSAVGRPGLRTRPIIRALGPHAYLIAATAHVLLKRRTTIAATVEGCGPAGTWRWAGECHALFVANQPVLGAGLRLPVPSSSDDGVCELGIVPRDSRLGLARNLTTLRNGRPVPPEALLVHPTHRATITLAAVAPFAADGDVVARSDRFDVEVSPRFLQVIV